MLTLGEQLNRIADKLTGADADLIRAVVLELADRPLSRTNPSWYTDYCAARASEDAALARAAALEDRVEELEGRIESATALLDKAIATRAEATDGYQRVLNAAIQDQADRASALNYPIVVAGRLDGRD